MTLSKDYDLLTLTATELQDMLERKELTGELLIELYLSQIQKHNHKGMQINTVFSTLPKAQVLKTARQLDEERAQTGPRGPMQGIPVIVKDTLFSPTLGLDTTCGSFTLVGAKAKKNAAVTDALLRAGMIVLAKTNLSEWEGMKQALMTGGWSAVEARRSHRIYTVECNLIARSWVIARRQALRQGVLLVRRQVLHPFRLGRSQMALWFNQRLVRCCMA